MTDDPALTYKLSDDVLKQIASGSGRCYPYEGRALAAEVIEWRRRSVDAAKIATLAMSQQSQHGGLYPPPVPYP